VHIQFARSREHWVSGGWIDDVKALAVSPHVHRQADPDRCRKGFGCIDAPRGALAHFSTINKGKITAYQCVVPYTWNGSPRCDGDRSRRD
jgi:Ni,Fe-hydrogenase I large subunit